MQRWIAAAIAAFALLASGNAQSKGAPEKPTPPLHILLSNDDGFPISSAPPNTSAAGTVAVCQKLVAAGHRVTIVTPRRDQSGSSGRISAPATGAGEFVVTRFTPPFSAVNRFDPTEAPYACGGPDVAGWAIGDFNLLGAEPAPILAGAGSPADSVFVALQNILAEDPPDLVVSGANNGQNVGGSVNHSGTVGAALAAAERGFPAIAISVELDNADLADRIPSETYAASGDAADFVVALIAQLQRTQKRNDPLLPAGIALNVNYPVVLGASGQHDRSLVGPAQITRVGTNPSIALGYTGDPASGRLAISILPCGLTPCPAETVRDADTTAIANDRVSITPLDGDWTADERTLGVVFSRLRPLVRP